MLHGAVFSLLLLRKNNSLLPEILSGNIEAPLGHRESNSD